MNSYKYINIIKKTIIVLFVLLLVVCFSLGKSYSNFVYKTDDYRAVEMIVGKLNYNIKINDEMKDSIVVNPGNSVLNIEIESNNEIDSYYKLLLKKTDDVDVYYMDNEPYGRINKNEKKNYKLLVINKSEQDKNISFVISSGYVNNTIDDVLIVDGYSLIDNKLLIGSSVLYETSGSYQFNDTVMNPINDDWKLLKVYDDGSFKIVSNNYLNENICFNGSEGYNNIVNELNKIVTSLYSDDNVITINNISLEDIEEFTNYKINSLTNLKRVNNNIYIPSLLRYEKNVFIDEVNTNGILKSNEEYDGVLNNSFEIVDSLITGEYTVSELSVDSFINEKYYELLFKDKNNYLLNRYVDNDGETVNYGILNMNNNSISKLKLYDSKNISYEICSSIRPVIKLSNKYILNIKK